MKKILLVTVILNSFILHSQNFWQQSYSSYGTVIKSFEGRIPGVVFAGQHPSLISDTKLLKTTNNGLNWIVVNNVRATCFSVTSEEMYMGSDLGLYRSTNNGNNWILTPFSKSVKFMVTYHDFIFVTTNDNKVFRSSDNANSWDSLNIIVNSYCLEADSNGVIFLGHTAGLYKSTDFGNNWTQPVTNAPIFSAAVLSNGNIIIGAGSPIFGILKSTNSGANWLQISNAHNVLGITVNRNSQIYALTFDHEVYTSTDNGNYWFTQNSGLSGNSTYSITVTNDGYLFVGGYNGSIDRSAQTTTLIISIQNEVPKKFHLYQNYPNPFNPETKIKFELPKASKIEFNIYDILGREICNLKTSKPAGVYEYTFDGSTFPSGIYFYNLKAGEYSQTEKMVLIK